MSEPDYDVAIVGYGPVGAVAANLLGQAGLAVSVFERTASVYHLPRARHFDDEVMRIIQSVGLDDAIAPIVTPVDVTEYLGSDGRLLFSVGAGEGLGPQGWAHGYSFYQPDLEMELRRGVDRFDGVDVYLEHEVERVAASDDAAEVLIVTDLNTGRSRHVSARWVLGCDGARSSCRGRAAIDLDELGFHELWLVIDAILAQPVELPAVSQQICGTGRPQIFVPSTGGHRRWEFKILEGEAPADVAKPDHVLEMLAPWVGGDDVEILRSVVYAFNALIARRWRDANLLLLGDAAHQMPPFLSQGMCAGIRDAANVCWKLALVNAGRADPGLLDSYQVEREPHVRTVTKLSIDLGRFLESPGVASGSGVPNIALPGLAGGLVHHGDDAGKIFPQPRVRAAGAAVRLDEALGTSFALVSRRDPRESMSAETSAFWESLGTAFVEVKPEGEPHDAHDLTVVVDDIDASLDSELRDDRVVVVRPDRYVYGSTQAWVGIDSLTAAVRSELVHEPGSALPT